VGSAGIGYAGRGYKGSCSCSVVSCLWIDSHMLLSGLHLMLDWPSYPFPCHHTTLDATVTAYIRRRLSSNGYSKQEFDRVSSPPWDTYVVPIYLPKPVSLYLCGRPARSETCTKQNRPISPTGYRGQIITQSYLPESRCLRSLTPKSPLLSLSLFPPGG